MRFRILGPLEVRSGQDWISIGAGKWRGLLAALLVNPGQVVAMDRLIDELWGDAPPQKAANQVSVYVHRLRKLIGDPGGEILVTRPPGYQLRLAAGDLDAARFDELVVKGARALTDGAAERASVVLGQALELWRGQALADVPPAGLVTAAVTRLEESRLTAAALRIEAELSCGRAAGVVAELQRLVDDNQLHEDLWALLMRALHASGRQAEALEVFARARKLISDELGVEPGAELRTLHQRILAGDARAERRHRPGHGAATVTVEPPGDQPPYSQPADPQQSPAAAVPVAAAIAPPLVPAQLPADIPDFTGRLRQVSDLCDVLGAAGRSDGRGGAVVAALVVGAGGLGKSTLAVHAAHLLRDSFPDGQLYAGMRGATEQPAPPAEVLARFLREMGVDSARVPVGEEERAALFRTELTGRRVLIVLDDARDAAQVRPLLPGCASCAVLVTTRNRLPDLAGGRFVDLDVLDGDEARAMLAAIVGEGRLAAEPDATGRVLSACAGLPLAIRIAGARLVTRRGWRIETLAGRLADERRRLDELAAGDLAVRACFEVSFASLPAPRPGRVDAVRVFRLLGLWQGTSVSAAAAAALLGEPQDRVADALEDLVDAQLLQPLADGRYRVHDLLRVYAADRSMAADTAAGRDGAIRRLLTWYLYTVAAADRVVSPNRERVPLEEAPPDCAPLSFSTVADALEWWEAERANLVTATTQAAACGMDDVAWKLPVAAMAFFNRRGYWADWMATHATALASARRLGDRSGEAWVLNNLGVVYAQQHHQDAIGYCEQALAIRRDLGDRRGEAQAANNLAFSYELLGRYADAVGPLRVSVGIQRATGHRYGESVALSNLAEALLEAGQIDEAVECSRQALAIAGEIGEDLVAAYTLNYLGRAFLSRGEIDEAVGYLEQALPIYRAVGERIGEADSLKHLGFAQYRTGQLAVARESWTQALAIYNDLGDTARAAELRAQLDETSPQ